MYTSIYFIFLSTFLFPLKGTGLNWISRVIGDYFQLFDMAFWFLWLLRVLACKIQPLEASKLIILVNKSPKMGHPSTEKKKKDGHGKS